MRHDTDPTPPEGIPRPSRADLAEAYLARWRMVTDDTADRDAIATLVLALDSLALVTRLWIWGDPHTLDTVVLASARDLFGWRDCPHCHEITHPDDWDARGYCSSCRDDGAIECHGCHEPGGVLDSVGLCRDCAGGDQDRDAYGAPYGGRDDLDDLGNPFGGALDR